MHNRLTTPPQECFLCRVTEKSAGGPDKGQQLPLDAFYYGYAALYGETVPDASSSSRLNGPNDEVDPVSPIGAV